MDKELANRLFTIYEQALTVLGEAESVYREVQDDEERQVLWRNHAKLIASLLIDFRAPLVREFPEFDTQKPEDEEEDTDELSPEEQEAVNQLGPAQIAQIDHALLENCAQNWRKVARVVGTTMMEIRSEFRGIPDIYYGQRIALLVSEGRLESQGNLAYMRFSEVRLPA